VTERMVACTPEETAAAGERLGARLPAGAVVACVGELGAGKTCFVQGVARGLGVTAVVTSPTFVLVNVYRGRVPVYHLDAYRADSLTEVVDLGLDEMMAGAGVTLIEWADKVLPLLPADAVRVTISGLGDEAREIVIEGAPAG
jgi:tRNA threonylcarbamoyladenosine biosynthesis protein TsaE